MFILFFLVISIGAFCIVDTTALHKVISGIPSAEKIWPTIAIVISIVGYVVWIISEIMPFLPTKANGIFHGIAIWLGIISAPNPNNPMDQKK